MDERTGHTNLPSIAQDVSAAYSALVTGPLANSSIISFPYAHQCHATLCDILQLALKKAALSGCIDGATVLHYARVARLANCGEVRRAIECVLEWRAKWRKL